MKIVLFYLFFLLTLEYAFAQKITYSLDEGFPSLHTEFNIIGKMGSRYLVHINNNYTHNQSRFCLYDSAMRLISIQKSRMPDPYFGISFIYYPTTAYMFYQYTKSDHTVLAAIKFDSSGKIFGNPIELTNSDQIFQML